MLHTYLNYEGLQNFSRRFSSASYNSSGSIYPVLDPSKKYAEIGRKMISFSKPDAISEKERSDATKYGTDLNEFFKKTAKEQIEAPDLIPKTKYAGGESEPSSEPASEPKGEAEPEAKEIEYEDIGEGMAMVDYDNLNATSAKSAINRARLLKADARMEGLEIKVTKTKTKKAIIVEVTADKKKDLVKSFRAELKELVKNGATGTNYYNYVQSMISGSAFKVIRGTPAPSRRGSEGGATPRSRKGSVGGATPAPTPAPATSASKAVTSALGEGEGEGGEWIPVGGLKGAGKKSAILKLRGASTR